MDRFGLISQHRDREIDGQDHYHPAESKIQGQSVVLTGMADSNKLQRWLAEC
jgi:hypothetical protein